MSKQEIQSEPIREIGVICLRLSPLRFGCGQNGLNVCSLSVLTLFVYSV
jgi:hypothetical protein